MSGAGKHEADALRVLEHNEGDYYAILNVPKTCSGEEIKRAWKKMVISIHPDQNRSKNATEAFVRANRAFETLSDPLKREEFDNTIRASKEFQIPMRPRAEAPSPYTRDSGTAGSSDYQHQFDSPSRPEFKQRYHSLSSDSSSTQEESPRPRARPDESSPSPPSPSHDSSKFKQRPSQQSAYDYAWLSESGEEILRGRSEWFGKKNMRYSPERDEPHAVTQASETKEKSRADRKTFYTAGRHEDGKRDKERESHHHRGSTYSRRETEHEREEREREHEKRASGKTFYTVGRHEDEERDRERESHHYRGSTYSRRETEHEREEREREHEKRASGKTFYTAGRHEDGKRDRERESHHYRGSTYSRRETEHEREEREREHEKRASGKTSYTVGRHEDGERDRERESHHHRGSTYSRRETEHERKEREREHEKRAEMREREEKAYVPRHTAREERRHSENASRGVRERTHRSGERVADRSYGLDRERSTLRQSTHFRTSYSYSMHQASPEPPEPSIHPRSTHRRSHHDDDGPSTRSFSGKAYSPRSKY